MDTHKLNLPDICDEKEIYRFGVKFEYRIRKFQSAGMVRDYVACKENGFVSNNYTYYYFDDEELDNGNCSKLVAFICASLH